MEKKLITSLLKKSGVDFLSVINSEISKLETIYTRENSRSISEVDLETLYILLSASDIAASKATQPKKEDSATRVHDYSVHYGRTLALITNVLKSNSNSSNFEISDTIKMHLLRLLKMSYTRSGIPEQLMVQSVCLQTFKAHISSATYIDMGCKDVMEKVLAIDVGLSIAHQILSDGAPLDSSWLDEMFRCSEEMLIADDLEIVGKLMSLVIPGLLNKANNDCLDSKLKGLWTATDTLYETYGQKTYQSGSCSGLSGRPLMVLCGLADWFFPVHGKQILTAPIMDNPTFWLILQSGFYNLNPLTRKRASYILKRLLDVIESSATEIQCCISVDDSGVPLFWWAPSYRKEFGNLWQDYILIMETLEEKQVHVIKPLLPRIASLAAATELSMKDGDRRPLLHTSWVCTLIQRMACHESSFIRREGICHLLQLDITKFPLLQQDAQEFTSNALIAMMAESAVYYKPPDLTIGSCAPAGGFLVSFIQSCVNALHGAAQKGTFLLRFVAGLRAQQWSGSALVYVSRALSLLPRLPVCGPQLITDIRSLLLSVLTNLEVHLRGAVQCNLATVVTKLLDTDHCSPRYLLALLSVLRADECLCRGTATWTELVNWLKATAGISNTWNGQALSDLVNNYLTKYLEQKSDGGGDAPIVQCDPVEVGAVVRLLVLSWDAELLLPASPQDAGLRDTTRLRNLLIPVTRILLTINKHAYMLAEKADRALRVLITLLQETNSILCGGGDLVSEAANMARECMHDIILFIIRRVTADMKQLDDVATVGLYMEAVRTLAGAGLDVTASPSLREGNMLLDTALRQHNTDSTNTPSLECQMRRFAAMSLLGCLADVAQQAHKPSHGAQAFRGLLISRCRGMRPIHSFPRPTVANVDGSGAHCRGHGVSTWGRISASVIQAQWQCLRLVLNHDAEHVTADVTMVDCCQQALDVTSGTTIIPILECVQAFIIKVDPSVAGTLVSATWQKVKEERRNTLSFWACLGAFTDAVFQPDLLLIPSEQLTATIRQVMDDFFDIGQEKEGLVNVLVNHLCPLRKTPSRDSVLPTNQKALAVMHKYADVILEAIIYGPIHDKSRRYYHEVLAFLIAQGDDLSINQLRDGRVRDDHITRVVAVSALSHLSVTDPEHITLAHTFLQLLYARHCAMNQNKSYRRFTNSLPHRQKHRLMVAVVVLAPFIFEGELLGLTHAHLMEMLVEENQPSVRFMVEWLLISIIFREGKDGPVFDSIVREISKTDEPRMSYLCSLFTVLTHATIHSKPPKQEVMMMRVLPAILPWYTIHHFNCRTFAQACILRLWDTCREQVLNCALSTHAIVAEVVDFQLKNINQSKGTRKLLNTVFFHFDPNADYSIETLTWTLPRLTLLAEDEWVPPEVWEGCDPTWRSHPGGHTLPLLNANETLKDDCSPGGWRVKVTESEDFYVTEGNVQKKLIPWSAMLPENNMAPEELQDGGHRQPGGQLIVVTSLIDKVPNLGGLCRTSEIFGVAEFVIGNMKYVRLHEFETLSVTAQKWVPIKEVRIFMLKEYLVQMKDSGYTLVGAEQTADSVSLPDYAFPNKTLLLLGNEKEGIPVELIQLLDVCVQIPQQGVIRSLNVHVSGALLIWEYTRQQLSRTERGPVHLGIHPAAAE